MLGSQSRLAARAIDGPVVVSRDSAWAYYRLATVPYEYRTPAEAEDLARGIAVALAGLRDTHIHLVQAPRSYAVDQWADALDRSVHRPVEGWADHLDQVADHLAEQAHWSKEVYLGVWLGRRDTGRANPRIARLLGRLEVAAGVTDDAITEAEQAQWARRAEQYQRLLSQAALTARPAEHHEVAWLIARGLYRGIGEPRPSASNKRSWGRGELEALADGQIERHPHMLRLVQGRDDGWVAFLSAARFPDVMEGPGADPWLAAHELLDYPVETSSRWELVPPTTASKHVRKRLAAVHDQERHTLEAGAEPPRRLEEQLETARALEHQLATERMPLVYGHTRFAVAADSPEELTARCEGVIEAYREHGIDVQWPAHDQLPLLLEAMPGDATRVGAYRQRHDIAAIGGGVPTATGDLGDQQGPYLGETTGRVRSVVHYDPLAAPARNRETTVALTGSLGGGKTIAALLMTVQMALRGVAVRVIDPKDDFTALANVLPNVKVIDLAGAEAGLLDPFAMADDPEEGVLMAIETMRLLQPGTPGHREQTALLQAANAEAYEADQPSLTGVVERLEASDDDTAQAMGANLRVYSHFPVARLCFAPAGSDGREQLATHDGVTIITARGLTFPAPDTRPDDYSWPERLAVAVMYLVADLTRRLTNNRPAQEPKAVVLDEAWMLTQTAQGRTLVPEIARMGRSRNTALLLASQNAGDLLDETVRNCVGTVFAFRTWEEDEIRDVCSLLRADPDSGLRETFRSLGPGECVMRDLDGRIGRMQVDLSYDPGLLTALDTTATRQTEGATSAPLAQEGAA